MPGRSVRCDFTQICVRLLAQQEREWRRAVCGALWHVGVWNKSRHGTPTATPLHCYKTTQQYTKSCLNVSYKSHGHLMGMLSTYNNFCFIMILYILNAEWPLTLNAFLS